MRNTHNGNYLSDIVSSRKPFGLPTNYPPQDNGMPCQFIQRIGLKYARKADVTDQFNLLNKWKIIVPKAPIAGQTDFSKPVTIYYESNTKILPPGTCCTESFIVLFAAETKEEVLSFKSYIYTKIARFLLLMSVVSQDITRDRKTTILILKNIKRKKRETPLTKLSCQYPLFIISIFRARRSGRSIPANF